VKYFLTLPPEFWRDWDSSPLHGYRNGDELIVEVDIPDNRIRLYTPLDYRVRNEELAKQGLSPEIKQPFAFSMPVVQGEKYVDLAAKTSYNGDKFEIFPIDGTHDFWYEKCEPVNGEVSPTREFEELERNYWLPRIMVRELTIYWDPDNESLNPKPKYELYSESWTWKCNVILPRKGGYVFDVNIGGLESTKDIPFITDGGTKTIYIESETRDGGWYNMYEGQNRGTKPFKLYAPAPFQEYSDDPLFGDGPHKLMWYWD
jgi:hypothetical protein